MKKTDVAEVVRSAPEQKAAKQLQRDYVTLQKYQLNPTNSFPQTYYGQVITNAFLKFLTDHPASTYQADIDGRIAQWQAELSQVSTGMVKYQGKWITAADWTAQWQQQRAQQMLAQAQQLLAQQQLANAGALLDQICLLTNAPPDVLATAHQLRLDTYRQLPELLTQRMQQLSNELAVCQQQCQEAQKAKAEAGAQHRASLSSMTIGSSHSLNQGGNNSMPQRIARGGRGGNRYSGGGYGGSGPVEPPQRMGADSAKIIESQNALTAANDALAVAQSCVDKLKAEQAAVQKNLMAAKTRATVLHITPTGMEPPTTTVAQAAPAPTTPTPSESTDVLQDSSNWFQRNWIFIVGGLVVAAFVVSRMLR